MVALAVFRIRQAYITIIECEFTLGPVRHLVIELLKDFNERYEPANETGQVKYTADAETGRGNRYTGVHPYFFVASFLDWRVKDLLHGESDDQDYIMSAQGYGQLKWRVLKLMVAQVKEDNDCIEEGDVEPDNGTTGVNVQEETNAGQPAAKSSNSAEDMDDLMWGNMACTNKEGARPDDRDDEEIRVECEKELNLFILSAGASIKNSDGSYVNPLKI